MMGGRWFLGVDIQPRQLMAVALSVQRDGFRLRGWWRVPLTPASAPDDLSPSLPRELKTLRTRLPRRLSVRTALPAGLVIRDTLPGSPLSFSPWQQYGLLLAQSERLLMLPGHELACDFSPHPDGGGRWQLCAVRRAQQERWCTLFGNAGLPLQRLTLAPCALRYLARLAGASPEAPLIHRAGQDLGWIAPWGMPFQYGIAQEDTGLAAVCAMARGHALGEVSGSVPPLLCGSGWGAHGWSGLAAVRHLTAPLPADPAQFCLALGLALMRETPEWTM